MGDEDEWSDDSTVGDSGSETDDWLEDDEPEGCAEAAPIFGKTIAPRTPPLRSTDLGAEAEQQAAAANANAAAPEAATIEEEEEEQVEVQ